MRKPKAPRFILVDSKGNQVDDTSKASGVVMDPRDKPCHADGRVEVEEHLDDLPTATHINGHSEDA